MDNDQRAREAAEEAGSAANIVSHDGYYEIDIDAVTHVFARFEQQIRASLAPSDRLREAPFDFKPLNVPVIEARISIVARAIRASLRSYGHRTAESSLPECIASDVERALRSTALASQPAASDGAVDPLIDGLPERIKSVFEFSGCGSWRTCSGCYESEDGYPNGDYRHSAILDCTLGGGCSECGGLGAIYDATDYEEMARYSLAEEGALAAKQSPVDVAELAALAAFGASDPACYFYPGKGQQPERAAFCAGAAYAVFSPSQPAAHIGREDWQPIETAPRDGTWFIAYRDGVIYPCEWITHQPDDGLLASGWYDHFNDSFERPTHWHPTPPIDATLRAQGEGV